jgi:hypothetical protein
VSTTSINGKKYGLVIVDDSSRWTWVKFLRSKSDTFNVFSEFCIQIQCEKDLKILKIRSDHGGEFENDSFESFCKTHGFIHEFSSPFTTAKWCCRKEEQISSRNGSYHDA